MGSNQGFGGSRPFASRASGPVGQRPETNAEIKLVGENDVTALFIARPVAALALARCVAAEMPEGCPDIVLFDCDRLDERTALRYLDRYLAADSPDRLLAGILLLREVQGLSHTSQAHLAELLIRRKRAPSTRIIASSSVEIFPLVRAGLFHTSLFYLLNTVTLQQDSLTRRITSVWPQVTAVGA